MLLLGISFTTFLFISEKINSSLYIKELNQKILVSVEYNVAKVDRYTASMEEKVSDLARGGEAFYRMREVTSSSTLDEKISRYITDSIQSFPEALGGGLWFEPYTFKADQKYFGPYAYWTQNEVDFTWDLNTPEYDYHTQTWYTRALPTTWNRAEKRAEEFYWTAPYIDEAGSESLMVTVDAFMFDDTDRIIGISTADWAIAEMLLFLESHKLSFDSHLFLVDGNSKIIMANTLDPLTILKGAATVPWMTGLTQPEKGKIQIADRTIQGVEYRVFYTRTEVGMVYGMLVPYTVIAAPLKTLFDLNLLAIAIFGVTLLVMFYIILSRITKPIIALTNAVTRVTDGDLRTQIRIPSKDEIGKLARAFNTMIDRLKVSYERMEGKVTEKTNVASTMFAQVEEKNKDLERSQIATINLLEDLEEEKQAVERKIKDRTEELLQEKNKLLQVTSNMKGGGILLDTDQTVTFTNDATYALLNLDRSVESSEVLEHFFAYFENTKIKEYYTNCISGNTFHVPEIDGNGKVYEIFFHHLKTDTEDVIRSVGYFILFFDISEAKFLERSKSELVAVASHQLRTPLTAMRGNVEMLIDESFGPLNKEQHELLDDVDVSTIRLISMVNDMLDITKIEQGNIEMHIEKLNVKEIIDSVVLDLGTYSDRHEFKIRKDEIASDLFVKGDKIRIRQIFQNLIDNAIKYSSHPGTLDITTKLAPRDMIEIAFKDNGIGVPKNEQSKLFGRFYRATNTSKTASSGSGLGLYIVKSLAQQLGGDIRFESEEEIGTTFFVTLPLEKMDTK